MLAATYKIDIIYDPRPACNDICTYVLALGVALALALHVPRLFCFWAVKKVSITSGKYGQRTTGILYNVLAGALCVNLTTTAYGLAFLGNGSISNNNNNHTLPPCGDKRALFLSQVRNITI